MTRSEQLPVRRHRQGTHCHDFGVELSTGLPRRHTRPGRECGALLPSYTQTRANTSHTGMTSFYIIPKSWVSNKLSFSDFPVWLKLLRSPGVEKQSTSHVFIIRLHRLFSDYESEWRKHTESVSLSQTLRPPASLRVYSSCEGLRSDVSGPIYLTRHPLTLAHWKPSQPHWLLGSSKAARSPPLMPPQPALPGAHAFIPQV